MSANVGSADKIIRFIIAIALFSLFFLLEGNLRYLALIGFIPLVTALMNWCPLYALFGIRTCPMKSAES